jgi:hypothetical protein
MATTRKTASSKGARTTKKTAGAGKKAASRKTTASRKSTTSRKSTAPRKSAAARQDAEPRRKAEPRQEAEPRQQADQRRKPRLSALKVARSAAEQLAELTGREPECVVGIESLDHTGWRVDLEVLESRRIPDSTDVLAIYEVEVDTSGELLGYHRSRRYIRGRGGDGREDGGR